MSKELNCKWFFGPQSPGNEKGPNDATEMSFKGSKYHSFIRESIQNSMDAVDDITKPVHVSFDYRQFSGMEFPEFFKLKEHIEGCLYNYPQDENAEKLFEPMLDYFKDSRLNQNIGYIRVTDTNTTGMHYDANDNRSPFKAFISEGVAAKTNKGSGGAFGFGKSVFWAMSPISTVFVSSKTDDEVNFEGITRLCTHYVTPGRLLSPNGLYDTDGQGEVITDEKKIPEEFRPKQKGTTVFVLGASNIDDEIEKELVKAVLRNFWMAIYNNKLTVSIQNTLINKNSLDELMKKHFELQNVKTKDVSEYNPRFYYDIVANTENETDCYKLITEEISMFGKPCRIKLYLHRQQEALGYFIFMRSPLMTVYIDHMSSWKGMDGLFVCDSDEGNDILREMENYQHDSWNVKNYNGRRNNDEKGAKAAIRAINSLVSNTVRAELQSGAMETQQIAGLEEILSIQTPKGEGDASKKDDFLDIENIHDESKNKNKSSGKKKNEHQDVRQPKTTKGKIDANGRLRSNNGPKKGKRTIPGPIKPGSQKQKSKEDEKGYKGIYAEPVDVSYRSWSQVKEDNSVWHIIRIFSDKEIDNAFIQLYAVNEDGSTIGVNIEEIIGDYKIRAGEEFVDQTDFQDKDESSKKSIKQVKNAISGVHINANIPLTLKVRFNSSIKYSLRINSDKIVTDNENK